MSIKKGRYSPDVAGLVLAAGMSRRAGDVNKLLHTFEYKYERKALVEHVAHSLSVSQVNSVLVVLGHDAMAVENALTDTPVAVSVNTDYQRGQASSLAHGVALLFAHEAIVVCLGDMPHVTPEVVNALIDAMREHPEKAFFVPVYEGQRGNPVLFTKEKYDEIMSLSGDNGARSLMKLQPDAVLEVAIDCKGVLIDYDTQGELASLDIESMS